MRTWSIEKTTSSHILASLLVSKSDSGRKNNRTKRPENTIRRMSKFGWFSRFIELLYLRGQSGIIISFGTSEIRRHLTLLI